MSSRALRKLQREQEEQRRLAATQSQGQENDSTGEDLPPQTPQPKNVFDMLEEDREEESEDDDANAGVMTPATDTSYLDTPMPGSSEPASSSKPKKKKKKKNKKRLKEKAVETPKDAEESEDEVDRALKALRIKASTRAEASDDATATTRWEASAASMLGVETRNLNPTNEMKSLFGSAAVDEHESRPSRASGRNPRQREVNEQGGMDLGTALLGRNNVASRGKELGTLAGRRNCLMRGREEWPLASSGGLSMESLPDPSSFEKRYKVLHNDAYRETQRNFRGAVESMDPQQMMGQLVMTPYHIASLLQVAEIARHQGDHSVSGDLLERALYTIGKSVHSSFPAAMRHGLARLSFDDAPNREVYLAIWRYIRNLEMRGTFKTAFEWSKLLLQLDVRSDPYGATLMIDQLALRGRSHDQLISLASEEAYGTTWQHLPNIKISLVLAYLRAKQPREARRQLALAMHQYPYILSALASALDISPLPKSLWAKLPSTDAEKLYTELYVSRAKDLWDTPETTALLVEVAETLNIYKDVTSAAPPPPRLEISLEEARHVILLEDPHILALLPRNFTRMPNSGYDPLPPPSSRDDFVARAPDDGARGGLGNIFGMPGALAGGTIQRILNWFQSPAGSNDDPREGEAAIADFRAEFGNDIPDDIINQLLATQFQDPQEPNGQQTPGGWDYYEDMANATSEYENEDDEDSEDMPALEEVPTAETRPAAAPTPPPSQIQARNPRAAMVEEVIDDDDETEPTPFTRAPAPQQPLAAAILRHIDSDSESEHESDRALDSDGIAPHPRRPTHTLFSTNAPSPTPISPSQRRRLSSQATAQLTPEQEREQIDNDPQRLQRWLLTSGLTELKPGQSTSNPALAEYVRRLRLLRPQQRDWVLGMVGQRGADMKGVVEGVRRALA